MEIWKQTYKKFYLYIDVAVTATSAFYCIEFALGSKLAITTVVVDFESALIFPVRGNFPEVHIVGCLFHLKQVWRRKMKKLRLPDSRTYSQSRILVTSKFKVLYELIGKSNNAVKLLLSLNHKRNREGSGDILLEYG
ncbi:hypothetical protein PHMEG_0009240 [Phytophthora megakarya]|uniref:MULE transposase domain-containing protein n=1 Tax=Phytophthora megakarya TaxID=4795 RepID=A0A225WIS0_9STRA|nr:hypothetical protein PHMEG_0009240 [Phytophthora megakarya]